MWSYPARVALTTCIVGVFFIWPVTAMAEPNVVTHRATATPGARVLLRHSIQIMRAVHQVHSDGILDMVHTRKEPGKAPRFRAHLGASGDCDGTFKSLTTFREAALFRVRARWVINDAPPELLDVRYISILASNHVETWERSVMTNNVWAASTKRTSLEAQNDEHVLTWICPHISMNMYYVAGRPLLNAPNLHTIGPSIVNGHPAWDVRSTTTLPGGTARYDFFIDRTSGYLLRFTQREHSGALGGSNVSFDYSRFNQRVSVTGPQPGSSTP